MPQITDSISIKRHLHPTKGWRKGEPHNPSFMPKAVQYKDGSYEVDAKKTRRPIKTGGMFKMRQPSRKRAV